MVISVLRSGWGGNHIWSEWVGMLLLEDSHQMWLFSWKVSPVGLFPFQGWQSLYVLEPMVGIWNEQKPRYKGQIKNIRRGPREKGSPGSSS